MHTYHVNLISSEDTPTSYSRKLPVTKCTNEQKSHDQSLIINRFRFIQESCSILPDHVSYEQWSGDETNMVHDARYGSLKKTNSYYM